MACAARIEFSGAARDQQAVGRHDPRSVDGRCAEGQRGASRYRDGAGSPGLHDLQALFAREPARSGLARARPFRAQLRTRLCAAVLAAASHGLRPVARGPAAVPAVGLAHPRSPRARSHGGHRGHNRAARPGRGQRRRHGDGRALPRRPLQPPRPGDRRSPRLRDLL